MVWEGRNSDTPAMMAYKTTAQNIGPGSEILGMSNVRYSSGGMALVSGCIQVPRTGWYMVSGNGTFASSTSSTQRIVGCCQTSIAGTVGTVLTGTAISHTQTGLSGITAPGVVTYILAGYYAAIWANTTVAYALNVTQPYMNTLSVVWVGP